MTLKVTRLGTEAEGALEDGRWSKGVLPGEDVIVTETGVRIEKPSDHRVKPKCRHAKTCGGCTLQHASQDFISDWKQGLVKDQLAFHGIACGDLSLVTSPTHSRRRCKFTGKRTKKGAIVGFFEPGGRTLSDLHECMVLDPALTNLAPHLRQFCQNFGSRRATIEFWCLVTDSGIDLAVDGLSGPVTDGISEVTQWAQTAGVARLSIQGEVILSFETPTLRFGKVAVVPGPGSFAQATVHAETEMQAFLKRHIQDAQTVIDLFSGLGHLGLSIVHLCNVQAWEGEADMVTAANLAARTSGYGERYDAKCRNLFSDPVPADELNGASAIVLNPPRAGAKNQAKQIAESDVETLVYVSCNPQTFAGDAAILTDAGFKISEITAIDQFRWSSHVEVLAAFDRS